MENPGQFRVEINNWSMERLAEESGVPLRTLARLEAGQGATRPLTRAAIAEALGAAGVEFIAENGGGAGVRLREPGSVTAASGRAADEGSH